MLVVDRYSRIASGGFKSMDDGLNLENLGLNDCLCIFIFPWKFLLFKGFVNNRLSCGQLL